MSFVPWLELRGRSRESDALIRNHALIPEKIVAHDPFVDAWLGTCAGRQGAARGGSEKAADTDANAAQFRVPGAISSPLPLFSSALLLALHCGFTVLLLLNAIHYVYVLRDVYDVAFARSFSWRAMGPDDVYSFDSR